MSQTHRTSDTAERDATPPKPPGKDPPGNGGGGRGAAPSPQAATPKLYGIYVGTPLQSAPVIPVDQAYANGNVGLMVRDVINLNAAAAASVISLGLVGWESVIDPFLSWTGFPALGAGVTLGVGDVTYPSALMSAVAASAPTKLSLLTSLAIANYFLPTWQLLGYPDLPTARLVGPKCELLMTTAGAAATGAIAWEIVGAPRI
jgi:hypothetical protein